MGPSPNRRNFPGRERFAPPPDAGRRRGGVTRSLTGAAVGAAMTLGAALAPSSSAIAGAAQVDEGETTSIPVSLSGLPPTGDHFHYSYRAALAGDGSLTPRVEIGAREDDGDAGTGFGVEVGGGIAWSDPGLGLSLDLSGRALLARENDDLKGRGYSARLGFGPAPATRRGPSLGLRQETGGRAREGLDALFAPDPPRDRTGGAAASRWTMEAAYGFPAFGGRFTGSPHVGFGLSAGARDYSLGWRLTPEAGTAPDVSFGLSATRGESGARAPEHTVGFEITARW